MRLGAILLGAILACSVIGLYISSRIEVFNTKKDSLKIGVTFIMNDDNTLRKIDSISQDTAYVFSNGKAWAFSKIKIVK